MIHFEQLGFPKPTQSHRLSVGHDLSTIEAHSQILGLRPRIIIAIRAACGVKLISTLQALHHWQSSATHIGFKLSFFFFFLSHICSIWAPLSSFLEPCFNLQLGAALVKIVARPAISLIDLKS